MNIDQIREAITSGGSIDFRQVAFDINEYVVEKTFIRDYKAKLFETNFYNFKKKTLLHFAIEHNNVDVVKQILSRGATLIPIQSGTMGELRGNINESGTWTKWQVLDETVDSEVSTLKFAQGTGNVEIIKLITAAAAPVPVACAAPPVSASGGGGPSATAAFTAPTTSTASVSRPHPNAETTVTAGTDTAVAALVALSAAWPVVDNASAPAQVPSAFRVVFTSGIAGGTASSASAFLASRDAQPPAPKPTL